MVKMVIFTCILLSLISVNIQALKCYGCGVKDGYVYPPCPSSATVNQLHQLPVINCSILDYVEDFLGKVRCVVSNFYNF